MLLDKNQPLFLRWSYLPRLLPWMRKYLAHANDADARRIAEALMPIIGDSLNDHLALADGTGAEHFVKPSDYLFLYNDRAHFEGDAFVWDVRRKHGFEWDAIEAEALNAYDPVYSDTLGYAVRLRGHGRIADPGAYVKALATHVVAEGGQLVKADVSDVIRENGAVSGVRAGGETIPCDTLVIATGVWSGPLTKKLGLKVPLEAERGYHIELWEPSFYPKSPLMIASGKFVMTPMEGRLRLAGMVEFGGLEKGPSKAPFDLLRANIKSAFPTLTWKEETEWMGHRPAPRIRSPSSAKPLASKAPSWALATTISA